MWCKVGDGEHSGQPCEADGWIDTLASHMACWLQVADITKDAVSEVV